jgi:hypothetical protein
MNAHWLARSCNNPFFVKCTNYNFYVDYFILKYYFYSLNLGYNKIRGNPRRINKLLWLNEMNACNVAFPTHRYGQVQLHFPIPWNSDVTLMQSIGDILNVIQPNWLLASYLNSSLQDGVNEYFFWRKIAKCRRHSFLKTEIFPVFETKFAKKKRQKTGFLAMVSPHLCLLATVLRVSWNKFAS